jgi:hypothetical protein
MKVFRHGWVAVVASFALAGISASAAVLTQTIDYGSSSAPVGAGMINTTFNEFNASLGELTGVTIVLQCYDTAQATVFSSGAGIGYTDAAVKNGSETVSVLGDSITIAGLSAGPASGTTTGYYTVAATGATLSQSASEIVLANAFSNYIGTSPGTLSILVNPGMGSYSGTAVEGAGFSGNFESYGAVEIDYTYTPWALVPEATYFATFSGGVAVLLMAGRGLRRRRPPV